jgi:glycosyltransferase involved in cell wall biosynthesis
LDVAKLYERLDVFTHGARIGETFGCVIAEAMANRIPVVTLSTPRKPNAQAELVDHKINGFVCHTQWQYANAVIELLQDHSLRKRMGEQAYQKASECFDARKIVSRLESLYFELMDTRSMNRA